MSFSNERVDHIRRRAEQATPGPWAWFGNGSSQQIYLATQRLGRHIVMDFARWGMRGAQPTFFGGRTVSLDASGLKRISGGEFQDTKSNAVYEVAPSATDINDPRLYRKDIIGIRNPDAEFLAHSREDIDDLLKEVDVRGRIIADGVKITADGGTTVRQVGWFCEHTYGTPSANTHMDWDHKKGRLAKRSNVFSSMRGNGYGVERDQMCPASVPMLITVAAEVTA